jgi:hypothetical protein
MRIEIQGLNEIITQGSGITGFCKPGFNIDTIETIESIRSPDPHKSILILDEGMDDAITQAISIGQVAKIE